MKNKFLAIFKNKFILSPIICVTVFSLALLTDLLTKGLIVSKLLPNVGDSKRIIPGFISFIYVKNKGAAWGIFQNGTIFLSIISILGTIVLITFYILRLKRAGKRASILLAITMGLLVAGALGNLVDRLAFGYVRDFINFDFISFPVFNFADAFLTIGIILLIVYIFFVYSKETPDEPIFKKKTNAVEDQSNKEKEDVNAHEGDDKDER